MSSASIKGVARAGRCEGSMVLGGFEGEVVSEKGWCCLKCLTGSKSNWAGLRWKTPTYKNEGKGAVGRWMMGYVTCKVETHEMLCCSEIRSGS